MYLATNVAFAGSSIGDNTLICDGVSISFKKVGKNCVISDGSNLTKNLIKHLLFK